MMGIQGENELFYFFQRHTRYDPERFTLMILYIEVIRAVI